MTFIVTTDHGDTKVGTYAVKLDVTGPGGSKQGTKTHDITVSAPPTAGGGTDVGERPSNMVPWFALAEASITCVPVASSKPHPATRPALSGATRASTKQFGKPLKFNRTSNWITVDDKIILGLTKDMRLEACVLPTTSCSDWATVITNRRTPSKASAVDHRRNDHLLTTTPRRGKVMNNCARRLFLTSTILIIGLSQSAYAVCDQTLNPGANVGSAITNAAPGSTICLNSGSYGTVTTGSFAKNPRVMIRSVSGQGAELSLRTSNGTNGLIFDSLTMGSSTIAGSSTKNITIQNSTFGRNQLNIDTTNFNENNILVDNCTFGAFDAGSGDKEGRLSIAWGNGPGSVPAGVTVTNSTFGPGGCSDGIQVGSYGVVIGPGNVFTGIVQGSCSAHVDAIQLYGQSHTTINGNYFVNNSVQVMAPDGGNTETITDNVFITSSSNNGIQLGSHVNGTFSHNTVRNITVNLDAKVGGSPSQDAVARNNIMLNSNFKIVDSNGKAACTSCTIDYNLFGSTSRASGTNVIIGTPAFVGGSTPATWVGYQLVQTSLGYRAASDGKDLGATYFGTGGTQLPAPTNLRLQ